MHLGASGVFVASALVPKLVPPISCVFVSAVSFSLRWSAFFPRLYQKSLRQICLGWLSHAFFTQSWRRSRVFKLSLAGVPTHWGFCKLSTAGVQIE